MSDKNSPLTIREGDMTDHNVIDFEFPDDMPLPAGYRVAWYRCHEHYQATGPDEWEGSISVDPYWCRAQAIHHAGTDEPLEAFCKICGETMEVVCCETCHGESEFFEDEPDLDDLDSCPACDGYGEYLECSRLVDGGSHTDEEMTAWRERNGT